ncbi:hypothetical protein C1H46_031065 [Malus baccata]|uniref:Chlorophyll a-b binding protein, chloroplastic n=1 Tax=Malus baccata TaxID=106549 RepID=A0A540LA74_MALBA|nr:hypothetical protein C1H46_031065 [Malus baccata]
MVSVAEPPKWLDGSLPGDRGLDPFGLGKPAEHLQFDYDRLDQNLAKNVAGDIIGTRIETAEAMLGALGALAVEGLTGVAWQDSGKVELIEGSSYLDLPLPFSITPLIWIEVLVIDYIEFQRNAELDPEKRLYPGGGKFFDPLGPIRMSLKGFNWLRSSMLVFLLFGIQTAVTVKGPISFLLTFNR